MELARKIAWPVIFLIAILVVWWWKDLRKPSPQSRSSAEVAPANSASQPAPTARTPHAASQVPTEGSWLVDEVARDIAEIILFASDAKADPAQALKLTVMSGKDAAAYQLEAAGPKGSVSHTLTLQHHAWSPADYAAWAAALLKAWQPPQGSVTPSDGGALTRNLTDSTTANLIREERRVSELLNKQPLDPELHERAAVVLGAFALREAAGNNFTDLRPGLCRMAAHLALARALRPELGVCGQLAEAIQLTLAARQVEALERVAKLPAGLEPWVTTLKMRNTGDWRLCANLPKASLLEQTAWARTVAHAVDATPLQAFLEKHNPPDIPDWRRAVFGRGFSVEHGHVFAKDSIAKEFADIAAARKAWSGKEMKEGDLVALLNEPAGRAVVKSPSGGHELAVLGWGQLAAQHQRHLCNAVYFTIYFLRALWGVPEEAAEVERETHTRLASLRLYPLLVRCLLCNAKVGNCVPAEVFAKAMQDAVKLCKEQPHVVSTANWCLLTEPCGRAMPAYPPSPTAWYQPSLPHGTAFDFEHRMNDLHLPPDSNETWTRSLALAPYDFDVIDSALTRTPSSLPLEERDREAFKNISEFHLGAMRRVAENLKHDPKAYAAAMAPACALDPDLYEDLGELLLQSGFQEEAAKAYQASFEKAHDRVRVSNTCDWLVNYYFDNGRKEDAVKIAEHAAEVYSYRGLHTAAKLMERMQDWEKAAAYYAAIAERYNAPGLLLGFLSRHKDSDPKVAAFFDTVIKSQFPEGMKKAALADFKEPPQNGAQFTSESQLTRQWGIKNGDVIVALDQVRIESFGQYDLVRGLKPSSDPLVLILWDGAQYREVAASVPDRRFGCDMDTYEKEK